MVGFFLGRCLNGTVTVTFQKWKISCKNSLKSLKNEIVFNFKDEFWPILELWHDQFKFFMFWPFVTAQYERPTQQSQISASVRKHFYNKSSPAFFLEQRSKAFARYLQMLTFTNALRTYCRSPFALGGYQWNSILKIANQ